MDDPKAYAKKVRKSAEVERLLGQFLRLGSTKLNREYDRGWEFAFNRSTFFKKRVNTLMEVHGLSFEEAFDEADQGPHHEGILKTEDEE